MGEPGAEGCQRAGGPGAPELSFAPATGSVTRAQPIPDPADSLPRRAPHPPRHVGLFVVRPFGDTVRRVPRVLAGLVLFGLGIASMLAANLGVAPWDVFHQGLAHTLGWSVGTVIIGIGLLLILLFVPLRESIGLGTALNAVVIGNVVDTTLGLLATPDSILGRSALMLSGPPLVAIGSGLYIGGGLGPGPRDGLMTGIAKRGYPVGRVRTTLEASVLAAGLLLGGPIGVGTLWFVVAIGPLVHLAMTRLAPDTIVRPSANPAVGAEPSQDDSGPAFQ